MRSLQFGVLLVQITFAITTYSAAYSLSSHQFASFASLLSGSTTTGLYGIPVAIRDTFKPTHCMFLVENPIGLLLVEIVVGLLLYFLDIMAHMAVR